MADGAGQRCMAASAMVAVGPVDHIIEKLCEEAQKMIPGGNLGAVINRRPRNVLNSTLPMLKTRARKYWLMAAIRR